MDDYTMNQTEIRREITAFKNYLDKLEANPKLEVFWACTPQRKFKDKELYPVDFQIFMEEIGDAFSDFHGWQHLLLYNPDDAPYQLSGSERKSFDLPNGKVANASEVLFVARDVDFRHYGFSRTQIPYLFFSETGEDWYLDPVKGSFFGWFKKHMLDGIEYSFGKIPLTEV